MRQILIYIFTTLLIFSIFISISKKTLAIEEEFENLPNIESLAKEVKEIKGLGGFNVKVSISSSENFGYISIPELNLEITFNPNDANYNFKKALTTLKSYLEVKEEVEGLTGKKLPKKPLKITTTAGKGGAFIIEDPTLNQCDQIRVGTQQSKLGIKKIVTHELIHCVNRDSQGSGALGELMNVEGESQICNCNKFKEGEINILNQAFQGIESENQAAFKQYLMKSLTKNNGYSGNDYGYAALLGEEMFESLNDEGALVQQKVDVAQLVKQNLGNELDESVRVNKISKALGFDNFEDLANKLYKRFNDYKKGKTFSARLKRFFCKPPQSPLIPKVQDQSLTITPPTTTEQCKPPKEAINPNDLAKVSEEARKTMLEKGTDALVENIKISDKIYKFTFRALFVAGIIHSMTVTYEFEGGLGEKGLVGVSNFVLMGQPIVKDLILNNRATYIDAQLFDLLTTELPRCKKAYENWDKKGEAPKCNLPPNIFQLTKCQDSRSLLNKLFNSSPCFIGLPSNQKTWPEVALDSNDKYQIVLQLMGSVVPQMIAGVSFDKSMEELKSSGFGILTKQYYKKELEIRLKFKEIWEKEKSDLDNYFINELGRLPTSINNLTKLMQDENKYNLDMIRIYNYWADLSKKINDNESEITRLNVDIQKIERKEWEKINNPKPNLPWYNQWSYFVN